MDERSTQTGPPSPRLDLGAALPAHGAARVGTIIPNRIFVGGIDIKTNEGDLRRFFSQHGAVKEVKIVIDRAGVSKGYGFVTFETPEDAQNILQEADGFSLRDKKLNIAQAIRRQQVVLRSGGFAAPPPAPCGTRYLTTSSGLPYIYHNGVAYFHPPDLAPPPSPWPPRPVPGSPVMVAHSAPPVYPQPAYHHGYQASLQCVPPPLQWSIPQSPVSSGPVLYVQSSDLCYQPVEMPADAACIQTAASLTDTAAMPAQPHLEHMVQPAYHPLHLHSPAGQEPIIMHQETAKEQKFHSSRQGPPRAPISGRCCLTRSHYTHLRKEAAAAELTEMPTPPATEPVQ